MIPVPDGGMQTIATHKAVLRATSATLCLALFSAPAAAQLRPGAEDRAAVLNAEHLGDVIFLNQMELCRAEAESLAALLTCPVVIGSIREGEWICL